MMNNILGTRYGLDILDNETDWLIQLIDEPTEVIITDTDEDEPIYEMI